MSRVTSFFDLIGNGTSLKRTLDASERDIRGFTNRVNRLNANVNVGVGGGGPRGGGGGPNVGQLVNRFASSSGTDPIQNFIASAGPKFAAVLAAIKVAEGALRVLNGVQAGRAAAARGDIAGEVAAEKQINEFAANIPIVGELGAQINEMISGQQEYLRAIQFATQQQDKLNEQTAKRVAQTRAEIERGEATVRGLDRKEAARGATPAERETLEARNDLDDELRRQEKVAAIDLDEGTAAGQANKEVRERLGREVSIAAGNESRGNRTARTKAFVEQKAKEQADAEKVAGERTEREQEIRRSRTIRTRAALEAIEVEKAKVEARRRGEADTLVAELDSQGHGTEAEIVAIEERRQRERQEAQGDAELESQADRRAKAGVLGIQRELAQRNAGQFAEVANPFTDLTGKFSGVTDPAAETAKVLKERIAVTLERIEKNTGTPQVAVLAP